MNHKKTTLIILIALMLMKSASHQVEASILSVKRLTTQAAESFVPHSYYDQQSNKTFVVYPAGINQSGLSELSPHIQEFNHASKQWSNAVKITVAPARPDTHTHTQITVDNAGYIHVFQTYHGVGGTWEHNILHATSLTPRSIANWNVRYIANTNKATYGHVFKSNTGTLYLFYRNTLKQSNPTWHEPEYYLKSTNNGATWTQHNLIDPGNNSDGWNTIYVKAIEQDFKNNGAHILFGIHQNHNDYTNKHYYAYFSFTNNQVSCVGGTNSGATLHATALAACELFNYDSPIRVSDFGMSRSIIIDKQGSPIVYYTKYDLTKPKTHKADLWEAKISGSKFTHTKVTTIGPVLFPFEGEVKSDGTTELFVRLWDSAGVFDTYRFMHKQNIWYKDQRIWDAQFHLQPGSAASNISYSYKHPDNLLGFFLNSYNPLDYTNPKPKGQLYALFAASPVTPTPTPLKSLTPTPHPSPTPTKSPTTPAAVTPTPVPTFDFNANGRIDLYDFTTLVANMGTRYTMADYSFVVANYQP